MLKTKDVRSIEKNPRLVLQLQDILKKVEMVGETPIINIGGRKITILPTPMSYATLIIHAINQIHLDNPDKVVHIIIPKIDEQLEFTKQIMEKAMLDRFATTNISMNEEMIVGNNSFSKFQLQYVRKEAEENYFDAIQMIIESADATMTIGFKDESTESIVNQIIDQHNNGMGHILPCTIVRPSVNLGNTINQKPIYIGRDTNHIDPKLNGITIDPDRYVASIVEINVGADTSLDAALSLNKDSVVYDDAGELRLGLNMIARCEHFISFAMSSFSRQTHQDINALNVWYKDMKPIYVINIIGVEMLAKTIVFDKYKSNIGFNDIIEITMMQNQIYNLIIDQINQIAAKAKEFDIVVIHESELIDYDVTETALSIRKLTMRKLNGGDSMRIKMHKTEYLSSRDITNHITNMVNNIDSQIIKIDLE